ncbi:MAG: hypothetical protein AAGI63_11540 [Planctomycetota bacterium]
MIEHQRGEMKWLPWAGVNLRRNPFGELSPEERAELAVVDVEPILARLSEQRVAVQFIGACGRGKTTRMLALLKHLPNASYTYLPEDAACPAIAMGDPILIDEAQRLPRYVRRRIWSSGISLVLSTHRDLRRSLRRSGYRVTTMRIGNGNTPSHVCQLLNRRIDASRLHTGSVPSLTLRAAECLVSRFGSDIRAMEHHLYEQLQKQVEQHGEVRSFDCVG